MGESVQIGYCGVCCSHCGMLLRIPKMAKEFKRYVQAYRYGEWIEHVTRDFEFPNFMKGLEWFAKSTCKGCIQGGGMPMCEVRNCCKERKLRNCYFCEHFAKCTKLGYQKETYNIQENHERIEQVGYEEWLREQEKKLMRNFDNIHFLEKRRETK